MIDMTLTVRERIILAATELLTTGGRNAVSTRAVSAAAGIQPPTIYRQFGDMQGLLDVVANQGIDRYIEQKLSQADSNDPVEDLRHGWDLHIAFGLANPAIYSLMYGDPRPGAGPSAIQATASILRRIVERIAEAGRLKVSVDRAATMLHAAGVGVVFTLLAQSSEARDLSLADDTREAILSAITTEREDATTRDQRDADRLVSRAVGLIAVLPEQPGVLSPGERSLLLEWLDRLSRIRDEPGASSQT